MITIKSHDEIAKIREAGKIVEEVFAVLEEKAKPGISTLELDHLVLSIAKKHKASCPTIGYGEPPFPAASCISIDTQLVHGIPSAHVHLEEGQIVTFDIVIEKDGWMADAARTFPIGQISEEKERLVRATEQSFWEGFKMAEVGNRVGDIGHAVQTYAEAQGYSVIREFTGHGIGRDMHESPDVPNFGRPKRGPRLQEGMVFCIEPMIAMGSRHVEIQRDGWTVTMQDKMPSAHYENTIAITKDGPKLMTLTI
jgi:methionyl aminopeptidase